MKGRVLKRFLKQKLKTYFATGLLVVGPIGLTVVVVRGVISWMDTLFYQVLPPALQPDRLLGYKIPGLGIVASLLLILLVGVLTANVIGRFLVALVERIMNRIPLIKSIYTLFKQVAHTTFGRDRKGFRQVVLIEYPRRGPGQDRGGGDQCLHPHHPQSHLRFLHTGARTGNDPSWHDRG